MVAVTSSAFLWHMGQGDQLAGGRYQFNERKSLPNSPSGCLMQEWHLPLKISEGPCWQGCWRGSLHWVELDQIRTGPFHTSPGSLLKADFWAQAKSL